MEKKQHSQLQSSAVLQCSYYRRNWRVVLCQRPYCHLFNLFNTETSAAAAVTERIALYHRCGFSSFTNSHGCTLTSPLTAAANNSNTKPMQLARFHATHLTALIVSSAEQAEAADSVLIYISEKKRPLVSQKPLRSVLFFWLSCLCQSQAFFKRKQRVSFVWYQKTQESQTKKFEAGA